MYLFLRLIHIGQFFNGLGGPVLMAACPVISALWFPEYQRTTATAMSSGFAALGASLSFIAGYTRTIKTNESCAIFVEYSCRHFRFLGPLLVRDVDKKTSELCSGNSSRSCKWLFWKIFCALVMNLICWDIISFSNETQHECSSLKEEVKADIKFYLYIRKHLYNLWNTCAMI